MYITIVQFSVGRELIRIVLNTFIYDPFYREKNLIKDETKIILECVMKLSYESKLPMSITGNAHV